MRTANEVVEIVRTAYASTYREDRARRPKHGMARNAWASGWHACTRQMALDVALRHTQEEFPEEAIARMSRGEDREADMRRRLADAGRLATTKFKVVGDQTHFQVKDANGQVYLSGKIDCFIVFDDDPTWYPVEFKSFSAYVMEGIRSLADMARKRWARHTPYQMLGYLYERGPIGFLCLDTGALPMLIPVDIYEHMDMAEDLLSKAKIATETGLLYRDTEDASILPACTDDFDECRGCPWFGRVCTPPEFNEAPTICLDLEVVEAARIVAANDAARRAWEKARSIVKNWADRTSTTQCAVGPVVVRKKTAPKTVYDVPIRVRESYKRVEQSTSTYIDVPGTTEGSDE